MFRGRDVRSCAVFYRVRTGKVHKFPVWHRLPNDSAALIAQTVPAKPGKLPRAGSLLALPASLRLLALKPAEDRRGWILRVQGKATHCTWLGKQVRLPANGIATWRLIAGKAMCLPATEIT